MVVKKKYLHNAQHAHLIERIALEFNLATAESYEMQGREHANKVFGREYKQKYDGVVETRKKVTGKYLHLKFSKKINNCKGRKLEGQKEQEDQMKIREESYACELQKRFVAETSVMKVDQLKAHLTSKGRSGFASMKKPGLQSLLVEVMLEKALKNIRIQQSIENKKERLKLLTSFNLLKKSVRLLKCKNPVYIKEKK